MNREKHLKNKAGTTAVLLLAGCILFSVSGLVMIAVGVTNHVISELRTDPFFKPAEVAGFLARILFK